MNWKRGTAVHVRTVERHVAETPKVLPIGAPRELALDVVLRGQAKLQRIRTQTRAPEIRRTSNGVDSWLSYRGRIDANGVLSLGFAAQELGLRTLTVAAPEGRFAIEDLRLLRASANRFNLQLALSVRDDEHGYAVAHWADLLVIEPKSQHLDPRLLRHLTGMGKGLVLKRSNGVRFGAFLDLVTRVRNDFRGELYITDTPKREENGTYLFDSMHLRRLAEKGNARVLLDLQDPQISRKEREGLAFSAMGSEIEGVVLPLELSSSIDQNFEELALTVQKLNALRYTLNALNHLG